MGWSRLVQLIAELLFRLGLATEGFHVEAGRRLHVTAKTLDGASLAPLSGVDVGVEVPLGGPQVVFAVIWFGRTGGSGQIDETGVAGWSFDTTNLRQPVKPPDMTVLFRLAGYRDTRIGFNLGTLGLVAEVCQLDIGSVTLSRV